MGLDSVELLMDFEDTFRVELTDEEATKAQTPALPSESHGHARKSP